MHQEKILALKALAKSKKIKNYQISEAIGISEISISAWFTLQKEPKIGNFMAMEKYINEYGS